MKVLPDTAYCMNLDDRTDRWEQVQKDFKRLSDVLPIKIERVSACAEPSKPQLGVAKTVHKVINIAKERNLEYVLLLEDDLYVIDPYKVKTCLENAPEDWDMLSGGAYHFSPDTSFDENWMKMKDFCSLHFIIFRNTIYDKILNIKGGGHMDRNLGTEVRNKRMVMYIMHPMPCQQRPGFSNIRNRNVNDNKRSLPWIDSPDKL